MQLLPISQLPQVSFNHLSSGLCGNLDKAHIDTTSPMHYHKSPHKLACLNWSLSMQMLGICEQQACLHFWLYEVAAHNISFYFQYKSLVLFQRQTYGMFARCTFLWEVETGYVFRVNIDIFEELLILKDRRDHDQSNSANSSVRTKTSTTKTVKNTNMWRVSTWASELVPRKAIRPYWTDLT